MKEIKYVPSVTFLTLCYPGALPITITRTHGLGLRDLKLNYWFLKIQLLLRCTLVCLFLPYIV
jgi:hypothetical protein